MSLKKSSPPSRQKKFKINLRFSIRWLFKDKKAVTNTNLAPRVQRTHSLFVVRWDSCLWKGLDDERWLRNCYQTKWRCDWMWEEKKGFTVVFVRWCEKILWSEVPMNDIQYFILWFLKSNRNILSHLECTSLTRKVKVSFFYCRQKKIIVLTQIEWNVKKSQKGTSNRKKLKVVCWLHQRREIFLSILWRQNHMNKTVRMRWTRWQSCNKVF